MKTNLEILKALDEKVSVYRLKKSYKKLKSIPKKDLTEKEKKYFEKLEKYLTKNKIIVVGTMSSGKSSVINSLLEKDLLPNQNEACTATICQIKDTKYMNDFILKAENKDGKVIQTWIKAEKKLLEQMNSNGNKEEINIYLEGNIKEIKIKNRKILLIDTPGTNNSQNEKHGETTNQYLKKVTGTACLIYVINATQLGTEDDKKFLQNILKISKKNMNLTDKNIIFLLNKIDCIDTEKEDLENFINGTIKYLKEIGVKNPIIFPLSAEFAKLLKLEVQNIKLSRLQQVTLKKYKETFLPNKEDNYKGIDTIKYCSLSRKEKEALYEESEKDMLNAYLNYSGIKAFEIYLNAYLSF